MKLGGETLNSFEKGREHIILLFVVGWRLLSEPRKIVRFRLPGRSARRAFGRSNRRALPVWRSGFRVSRFAMRRGQPSRIHWCPLQVHGLGMCP